MPSAPQMDQGRPAIPRRLLHGLIRHPDCTGIASATHGSILASEKVRNPKIHKKMKIGPYIVTAFRVTTYSGKKYDIDIDSDNRRVYTMSLRKLEDKICSELNKNKDLVNFRNDPACHVTFNTLPLFNN